MRRSATARRLAAAPSSSQPVRAARARPRARAPLVDSAHRALGMLGLDAAFNVEVFSKLDRLREGIQLEMNREAQWRCLILHKLVPARRPPPGPPCPPAPRGGLSDAARAAAGNRAAFSQLLPRLLRGLKRSMTGDLTNHLVVVGLGPGAKSTCSGLQARPRTPEPTQAAAGQVMPAEEHLMERPC
jgi:hypothetical protein